MYRSFTGGGWAHPGYFFGFSWGGIVLAVILIGLAVFAVVSIRRRGKTLDSDPASASQQGLLVLTERFVRGEIDTEAFRSMKAELAMQPESGYHPMAGIPD
ncbi:MAG: hypothetical protein CVV51_04150 [Spirochaetae bacterium HGW-Spirochaetae-7]|jgi:uncharacterized membrane protein|nr:MAG: hypothetical protein CVV51_04150 [Spirochaetae bacterium HGW-Spirochaetae-7]